MVASGAREILDRIDPDPPILGHTDWRAENLRFDGQQLSAVFDWECLLRTIEPILVGAIAHAFPSNWSRPSSGPQTPSPQEARAFVAEYEDALGRSLDERRLLGAAYAYATAYTARCEHAVDPARERADEGFRTLIDRYGAGLLDLFLAG